jgi:hypothetical protein
LIRRDRTVRKAALSLVTTLLLASVPAWAFLSGAMSSRRAAVTFVHGADPSWPMLVPAYLEVIAENASSLGGCFSPAASSCVVALEWTIDHDGRATNIVSPTPDASACAELPCMRQALERWRFPGGKPVAVSCPFGFGKEGEVVVVSTPEEARSIIR